MTGARPIGRLAMTALAGGVAAATMLSIPGGLLEIGVASSGLSELIPAAAPPLGVTARIILALGTALAAMGVAMAMQRPARAANAFIQTKENTMGFAFSRLADFARGNRRGAGEAIALARRPEDAHPDAPPRRPIFASQDFAGAEIFRPGRALSPAALPTGVPAVDPMAAHLADIIAQPEVILSQDAPRQVIAPAPVAPTASVTFAPQPVVAPAAVPAPAAAAPAPLHAPHRAPAQPVASAPLPRKPVAGLSLGELASRFEQGLARREQPAAEVPAASVALMPVAPAPVAPIAVIVPPRIPTLAELPPAEPVPVPPMLDADIDEALRAALGTLQKMAVRGR